MLRVDTHTAAKSRGRFARLYVQISLDKPLIKRLQIGGLEQPVLYEGLSSLCFTCGRVGHNAEVCPYHARAPENIGVEEGEGTEVTSPSQKENTEQAFGPWVLVTRKRQHGNKPKKDPNNISSSVLSDNEQKSRAHRAAESLADIGEVKSNLGKSDAKRVSGASCLVSIVAPVRKSHASLKGKDHPRSTPLKGSYHTRGQRVRANLHGPMVTKFKQIFFDQQESKRDSSDGLTAKSKS